ncbi:MAG: hypothetical protein J0M26_24235 [Planctomycetes bacterium]|nr:hypothetical protein [Planctomycetota bacterium]
MNQQKSAYFLIMVSFVMGMIATTSISGCDSGKKGETSSTAPKSSLDGEGSSQIQMDKPAENAAPAADAPAAEAPAADKPAADAPPPVGAPAAGGN